MWLVVGDRGWRQARGIVVMCRDVAAEQGQTHGAGLLPFWGIMLSLMVSDKSG